MPSGVNWHCQTCFVSALIRWVVFQLSLFAGWHRFHNGSLWRTHQLHCPCHNLLEADDFGRIPLTRRNNGIRRNHATSAQGRLNSWRIWALWNDEATRRACRIGTTIWRGRRHADASSMRLDHGHWRLGFLFDILVGRIVAWRGFLFVVGGLCHHCCFRCCRNCCTCFDLSRSL